MPQVIRAFTATSLQQQKAIVDKKRQQDLLKQKQLQQKQLDSLSLEEKEFVESIIKSYDLNKDGVLDKNELKQLMTDLNKGKEPKDSDVDIIMRGCDSDNSGKIEITEVRAVLRIWYMNADVWNAPPRKSCCVIQ
eukprot:TRINITY_DN180821_c0_g1_i2.p4 TRINITY_DN180821_c0_g1~~TRINITY_DN180821_c0_g1_i2.p4  ORF type:complete len:135 (-),score=26.75 TRINITY_DN180821_c0_g1_i2:446-850(-)